MKTCTSVLGLGFAVFFTTSAGPCFAQDMTPPTVGIYSPYGTHANTPTPSFLFAADEPCDFVCSFDGGAGVACTSGPYYMSPTPLSDGPHTFTVVATDLASNVGQDDFEFEVDTVAPTVTITPHLGPYTYIADNTPTFDFSLSEPGIPLCRIISPGPTSNFVSCESPWTVPYTLDDDVPYLLEVQAVDPSGNYGPTDYVTFVVDGTPPVVEITSGPEDGSSLNDSIETFEFSSTEAWPATFECRIDSDPFAMCASPYLTPSLADGEHTLEVRATDHVGNVGAPTTRTYTVGADTVAPNTTITGGPACGSTIDDATPSFDFASEPNATFECSLDGGAFAVCTSSSPTTTLSNGDRTFAVRAKDLGGNVDPTPASCSFTVLVVGDIGVAGSGVSLGGGADPEKRKLQFKSADAALDIGLGNGTVDDPTIRSATIRVVGLTFDDTYDLPASNWVLLGADGDQKGYKYRDGGGLFGPITALTFKATTDSKNGKMSFKGAGAALGHTLASYPGTVSIAVTMGGRRFCADFGGTVSFKSDSSFKSKDAAVALSCPAP